MKSGCGLLESQGLRETAGREKHPPQDHISDPRRNQGGRRPGVVCAGGLDAAPTSAISLRLEWARSGKRKVMYGGAGGYPRHT